MLNDVAMTPKDPDDPGPAYYNPPPSAGVLGLPKPVKPSLYPFNSSSLSARPIVHREMIPGPGR